MPSVLPFSITLLLASLSYVHPLPLTDTAGCDADLLLLAPCLPFANGAVLAPSDTCCDNLGNVLHDQPSCVCHALNQSSALPVNRSLVLELPRLCRLDLAADARTCPGILPLAPSASPPANGPRPSANSAASMPAPPSPRTNSLLLGKSWGFKLRVDGTSEALSFMALVLALAF